MHWLVAKRADGKGRLLRLCFNHISCPKKYGFVSERAEKAQTGRLVAGGKPTLIVHHRHFIFVSIFSKRDEAKLFNARNSAETELSYEPGSSSTIRVV